MRSLSRVWLLTIFLLFSASASAWAAIDIWSASINYTTNQITITGKQFSLKPIVVFNGTRLTIVGTPSGTNITAQLPDGVTPGTYELRVTNHLGMTDRYEVTYGAEGLQGPQGTQGVAGPEGPPNVIQILSGFQNFTSNGMFTVPDGINYVLVEMCGGGGGGGYQSNDSGPVAGGGGGGGYIRAVVPVTPGDSIPITVGAAGSTPDNGDGLPGGDSWFGNILFAGGGQGGKMDIHGGAGGAGGFVTGGLFSFVGGKGAEGYPVGDTCFNGNNCIAMEQGGLSGFRNLLPENFEYIGFNYGTGGAGGLNLVPAGSYPPNNMLAFPGFVRVSW
jgi:Glycine-rich domain